MLRGKKILLGLTGSISAYKAVYLLRFLIKEGAEVKVVMTSAATEFVSPLSFSALSKNTVLTDLISSDSNWNNHVETALWADLFIVAPVTANTLSKFANGICDNILTACYLSARCPVMLAPAMDSDMYAHKTTKRNLETLINDGCHIIRPDSGELASGLIGEGRLQEPETILNAIKNFFSEHTVLSGYKALVTAGPTYENIDPARFIGNHSSGLMGFSIAESLADAGAEVTLVAGPVQLQTQNAKINRIDVQTAEQMHAACMKYFSDASIIVMAAAVSDFKVSNAAVSKIKKEGRNKIELILESNKDILLDMGEKKSPNQILAGFALETDNEIENAKSKIKNKNLDFIVLNSLNDKGAGFRSASNKITIISKDGTVIPFGLKTKEKVADDITQYIVQLREKKNELPL